MINMGLKTADICDLDNRPKESKNIEKLNKIGALDSSFDNISLVSEKEVKLSERASNYVMKKSKTSNPLLNPKNYPFY
jgi:hypothetical protein